MYRISGAMLAAVVLALAGCGGGGGDGGIGGTGTTAVVSTGVMTKGSVVLNGVRFDDSRAGITLNGAAGSAAQLKTGMVVKLRGRINSDGVSGTAEKVQAENEVRGTVQTKDPATGTMTVNNQTVLVDDQTAYANMSGLSDPLLRDGISDVGVHGLRDGNGVLRATYIERSTTLGGGEDSVKGVVTNLSVTPPTFVLAGPTPLTVDYSAVIPVPALSNGTRVEVHGDFSGGVFAATRIDLENEEDAEFEPQPDDEFEVEGYVTGCGSADPCTSFAVNGQPVQVNSSTQFQNGAATDLADNIKVEVEGRLSGTTLLASKITFKRTRVLLQGIASAVSGTTTGTVTVLGIQVQVNSATAVQASSDGTGLDSNSLVSITPGSDRVNIQGYPAVRRCRGGGTGEGGYRRGRWRKQGPDPRLRNRRGRQCAHNPRDQRRSHAGHAVLHRGQPVDARPVPRRSDAGHGVDARHAGEGERLVLRRYAKRGRGRDPRLTRHIPFTRRRASGELSDGVICAD